jgi:hypothetical protein
MASNNVSHVADPSLPAAGAIDAYCGVESNESPLPPNLGADKGTTFCADEAGILTADTPADALAFAKANQAKITAYAAAAPSAVSGNNPAKLQIEGVPLTFVQVDLYCGANHLCLVGPSTTGPKPGPDRSLRTPNARHSRPRW